MKKESPIVRMSTVPAHLLVLRELAAMSVFVHWGRLLRTAVKVQCVFYVRKEGYAHFFINTNNITSASANLNRYIRIYSTELYQTP